MMADELAQALGGSRNGKWYNIPGPGHNSGDRSLGFCCDPLQPSGIRIFSFAGDDPKICRLHVLKKLSSLSTGMLPAVSQNVEADLGGYQRRQGIVVLALGRRRRRDPR